MLATNVNTVTAVTALRAMPAVLAHLRFDFSLFSIQSTFLRYLRNFKKEHDFVCPYFFIFIADVAPLALRIFL